jgi:hypothetical protein
MPFFADQAIDDAAIRSWPVCRMARIGLVLRRPELCVFSLFKMTRRSGIGFFWHRLLSICEPWYSVELTGTDRESVGRANPCPARPS